MIRDNEAGFTLVELLLAMVLSLIILTATLAVWGATYRNARTNDARFDTTEMARNALDAETRQLRNIAKRLNNTPVIDTVGNFDLIFQTSDPEKTWMRYCLDTTAAPASTSRGRLWAASLSLPVAATAYGVTSGMRSTCPGTGWTRTEAVADYVTNRVAGIDRPLFSYRCTDGTAGCTTTASTYDQIVNVSSKVIVDTTPGTQAKELLVSSGVHLRNQNQAPAATFAATATQPRTVLLNASGSTDYEGRTLRTWWFKGTMPTSVECDQAAATTDAFGQQTLWGGALLGEGITLSHQFPIIDGAAGTLVTIGLVVCDPGDRFGTAGIPPAAAIRVPIPN